MYGALVLEVRGTFDEALAAARELASRRGSHALVNSVNPYRREGQKTAVFEIVEELGGAPDAIYLPYGGGGNTTAYGQAFAELGGQPSRLIACEARDRSGTVATAIRIAEPVHASTAAAAIKRTEGRIVTLDDGEILAAWEDLARTEGLFCEPSSAAGLAALTHARPAAGDRGRRRSRVTGSRIRPAPRRTPADRRRARSRRDRSRLRADVIVRAPATSANIGPGFDSAAVAFDLWNELEVTDGAGVVVEGEGAAELPADGDQPRRSRVRAARRSGGKRFRFVNRIPLERGLGSSAAAIALGLVAAAPGQRSQEAPGSRSHARGHADNLGAALLGGLTLVWEGRIARIAERLPLDAIAIIPNERTSTEASRGTLPATVAHADDAAATAGRAACSGPVPPAGDAALFAAALWDRLHEPYRPSSELEAIRADLPPGCEGATLSGSGPTVIAWASDASACAAALRGRFPAHDVVELAVAPRGALVSVRLVDVRPRAAYDEGHVPGAVHLDPETELSAIGRDAADGGRHPLPAAGQLADAFGRAGIADDTFVLALDDGSGWAARCWWLLRHVGHDAAGTLDVKGYAGPLTRELAAAEPTAFTARERHDDLISAEEILARLGDPTLVLIDARSRARWRGDEEPLDPVAGRIPGARNAFFQEPLPIAASEPGELVPYCGSGVTACVVAQRLILAGRDDVRLYPGSFSEWCRRDGYPIETGALGSTRRDHTLRPPLRSRQAPQRTR